MWELALACEQNDKDKALYIAKKHNEWNKGMVYACKFGRKEIAELMIINGATHFNHGMEKACKYNQIELIELMITYGANDWNRGLAASAYECHKHIAQLMIKKGAKNFREMFFIIAWYINSNNMNKIKNFVLFLLIKGAKMSDYIRECYNEIQLDFTDLEFLYKNGVDNFDIYEQYIPQIKKKIKTITNTI